MFGYTASRAIFAAGIALVTGAALLAASVVSPGHLAGSLLLTLGLFLLARERRLASIARFPGPRAFTFLFLWVAFGYALYVWTYYWSRNFWLADTGIFTDLLANIALRGSYYSELVGMHGLADHFTPTLALLFAPLFRLEPTCLWLIGAKILATLACPLLLYALGREILAPGSKLVWVVPSLSLLHTPLAYSTFFQFQPTHLGPPLLLAAYWLAIRRRRILLCCLLLFAFGLKEDMPLLGISVGVLLVVERRQRRWGTLVALGSLAVGFLIAFVVMPTFAEGGPVHWYGRFEPWALLPQKVSLLVILLASVGFLPLLAPRTLLLLLPLSAIVLVSGLDRMMSFRYHYQAVISAGVLAGALYGLRAIERNEGLWRYLSPAHRQFVLAAITSLLFALNGTTPAYTARLFWPSSETRAATRDIIDALAVVRARLPPGFAAFTSRELVVWMVPYARQRRFDIERLRGERAPHAVVVANVRPVDPNPPRGPSNYEQVEALRATKPYHRYEIGSHVVVYTSEPVPGFEDGAAEPTRSTSSG